MLTTSFRVAAWLARCNQAGQGAYLVRRGDETAGAVLITESLRDGRSVVHARRYGLDGEVVWESATGAEPVEASEASAYVDRRTALDPDIWVLEVESLALSGDGPPFSDAL